jgi:stearoyl-CoA desaturase (delta-9 desaturase)
MGWLVMKQHPDRMGRVNIADLNHNTIVMLQHRYYIPIALFTGYAIPTLVACFWGDPFGGFIYAGVIRIFMVNQATFAVNSLAHWLGDQPFDDRISPRDHIVTALATMGEGYHNFHHEFPSDYRNAIKWHQYDPTKWCIWTWKQMGLAYNLQEFPTNEIEKGQVQQIRKKLDQRSAKLDWGVPVDQLPVLSWDEFQRNVKEGGQLIAISGVIYDVSG